MGETLTRGYVPPATALEQVQVGAPREQVLLTLGTPSTTADFGGEVFYYISQRTNRPVAFMNAHVIDQTVLAIYFDQNSQVDKIANYGLQDGKIVDLVVAHDADRRQGLLVHLAALPGDRHQPPGRCRRQSTRAAIARSSPADQRNASTTVAAPGRAASMADQKLRDQLLEISETIGLCMKHDDGDRRIRQGLAGKPGCGRRLRIRRNVRTRARATSRSR